MIGLIIKRDTRSLDYGSFGVPMKGFIGVIYG